MSPKGSLKNDTAEKSSNEPKPPAFRGKHSRFDEPTGYKSDGVTDNDIFLLPGSDFQILGALTVLAAVIRLFRIYQPTSVVFDEVQ
jgi:dolichyl-phosphate-mannose-protein mannosyltransferase